MLNRIWPEELQDLLWNEKNIPLMVDEKLFGCTNCNDAGVMMVFEVSGGPYQTPISKVKWLDLPTGSGWYSGELKVGACPVCKAGQKKQYLVQNCGMEGPQLGIFLSGFTTTGLMEDKAPAKEAAADLLAMNQCPSGFVTFWGDYGRGKSHLLMAIANGFRMIGVMSQYKLMSDLLAEIRSRFGDERGSVTAEDMIESFRSIKVLCIDELNQINLTPWVLETVNRLIDSRYIQRDNLLTVVACNASPDNLPVELHYLTSRMKQGTIVEVRGVDVREALQNS